MIRPFATLSITCLSLAIGCGNAHQIRRDQSGGTIALEGERNEAIKRAREMMLEHCHGPYQIVEEAVDEGDRRITYRCGQVPRSGGSTPDGGPPVSNDGYDTAPSGSEPDSTDDQR